MAVLDQAISEKYALYLGDCVEVMNRLPDESIHLTVYSPPFAGLFQYSSDERDLSNCRSYEEFLAHYEYVIGEIHRITMPGRISAVHCMDIPKSNSGRGDAIMDFPGDIAELHVKCRKDDCKDTPMRRRKGLCGHGWFELNARYHVWKEPLGVRNRTMMKALAHKTIVNDATLCGVASADYLLCFRRSGQNPTPVANEEGLTYYAGSKAIPADVMRYKGWQGKQIENRYSHWIWRQYASACWDDIRIDNVLPYRQAREEEDERHIHPLQLDVIERCVVLWTNPNEKVFTPFMGVGSEVYGAVKNGRLGIGAELKPSYFYQAVQNVKAAAVSQAEDMPLFGFANDGMGDEDELETMDMALD